MTDFETVKQATNLKEFCLAHGMKQDRTNTFICPSCGSGTHKNKNAAFTIDNMQHYHCYSCEEDGDIFDLAKLLGKAGSKAEQLQYVAAWANIPLDTKTAPQKPFRPLVMDYSKGCKQEEAYLLQSRANIEDPAAAEYLLKRGIYLQEAKSLGIGYDPATKRLVLPWLGSSFYHIDRDITDNAPNKYRKPKSEEVGKQPIYNPAALQQPAFFIVEGVLDAIAVNLCGYEAIATGGTGTNALADYLISRKYKGVAIVLLDNDEAGKTAAAKLQETLTPAGVETFQAFTTTKDPAELLKADREALKSFLTGVYNNALTELQRRKEEAYNEGLRALRVMKPIDIAASLFVLSDTVEPTPTGFNNLDEALGGGLPMGLVCLGAVSSLGKTTFAVQLADNIAASGRSVLFVTIEQSAQEITAKSLSRYASTFTHSYSTQEITSAKRREGWNDIDYTNFSKACEKYTNEVADNLRILEAEKQPSVEDIKNIAQYMTSFNEEAPIIFIDYLQLLAPKDEHLSDKKAVDVNISDLRRLAKELKTTIFVISSLNRASYSEGVTMESFKESGAIEYGSDVLLGLQPAGIREHLDGAKDTRQKREANKFIQESKKPTRECELVILKNRGGRICDEGIPFTFNAVTSTFRESKKKEIAKTFDNENVIYI
jgi:replicative DNA helicase